MLEVTTRDGENFKRIPRFWNDCYQDGTCEKLCSAAEGKNLLGICLEMDHDKEQFTYMIAVEGTGADLGKEFCRKRDPSLHLGGVYLFRADTRGDSEALGKNLPGMVPGNRLRARGNG